MLWNRTFTSLNPQTHEHTTQRHKMSSKTFWQGLLREQKPCQVFLLSCIRFSTDVSARTLTSALPQHNRRQLYPESSLGGKFSNICCKTTRNSPLTGRQQKRLFSFCPAGAFLFSVFSPSKERTCHWSPLLTCLLFFYPFPSLLQKHL